jgi:hypothetical protein
MRLHHLVSMAVLIAAVVAAAGAATQPVDISGTWSFSMDMGNAQGTPTFVFKQQGERLSGTVTRPTGEQQKVSGNVKGDKAVFWFEATRDGRSLKATYRGTIESAAKMSGAVEFTGAITGTGTWTAVKK